MKRLLPALALGLAATAAQSPGHPFVASRVVAASDSFLITSRTSRTAPWRTIGGLVQTVARDTNALRIAVEYAFIDSKQRVEMAMDRETLAPIAHWEHLANRNGDTRGEVIFRDGRARGAFILSKGIIDVRLDTGIVDDDASTALLTALPIDSVNELSFRTFASPGEVQLTRVRVARRDTTVVVPAGRFNAHRLLVMSRDTSHVYVSTAEPRRIILVQLGDGLQEMALINARR